MRTLLAIAAVCLVGVVWAAAAAAQLPQANAGSGVVTVAGTVEVGNTPSVRAEQSGDWRITVANTPDVRVSSIPAVSVAPPEFLKAGVSYEVTWADGTREGFTVAEVRPGGWVRVAAERERWVNLAAARSVQTRQ